MQNMTDEFIKDECVKNLCTMLGVPEHEFLPHLNLFLIFRPFMQDFFQAVRAVSFLKTEQARGIKNDHRSASAVCRK